MGHLLPTGPTLPCIVAYTWRVGSSPPNRAGPRVRPGIPARFLAATGDRPYFSLKKNRHCLQFSVFHWIFNVKKNSGRDRPLPELHVGELPSQEPLRFLLQLLPLRNAAIVILRAKNTSADQATKTKTKPVHLESSTEKIKLDVYRYVHLYNTQCILCIVQIR